MLVSNKFGECEIVRLLAIFNIFTYMYIFRLKTCGATRNPEFPQDGLDQTEAGPGSGHIFKNIFGSGRVGEFYFGSVRVGDIFYLGMEYFSRDFGDKLET